MRSRERILKKSKDLGLRVIVLEYDRRITPFSGGWRLEIEDPYFSEDHLGSGILEYSGDDADEVIAELEERWAQ
jgi:hypothetical protein